MAAADSPSITPPARELPAGAAPAFDAAALARRLLRTTRAGALATLDPLSGHPLATLVTVATDVDGAPLLFLSGLSLHTRNLDADGRASLLLAEMGKGDPLAHPRLSLVGHLARAAEPRLARRFLARHPKALLYAELPDFAIWRMAVSGAHLNGGFARAAMIEPADILLDLAGAEALLAAEEELIDHLNRDPALLRALQANAEGGAVATGIDPEGIDLLVGDKTARYPFPKRIETPDQVFEALHAAQSNATSRK